MTKAFGHDRRDVAWESCRDYILSRQSGDGGFCYFRSWGVEESTTPDTYHAIAALRTLRTPVPREEATRNWLLSQQKSDGSFSSLTNAYFSICALALLATPALHDPFGNLEQWADRLIHAGTRPESARLRDGARLATLFGKGNIPARLTRFLRKLLRSAEHADGGYGVIGNLPDTACAIHILKLLGQGPRKEDLEYLRRCEDRELGFLMTPESRSTGLEVTHGALCILRDAHERPTYGEAAWRYLVGCQTVSGGFGRAWGAIATIEATYHAVRSAALLQNGAAGPP